MMVVMRWLGTVIVSASVVLGGGCQRVWKSPVQVMLSEPTKEEFVLPGEIKDGWVILEASVNGHPPMRFALDTGAPTSVLSSVAAKELAFDTPNKVGGDDITGTRGVYPYGVAEVVRVGTIEFSKMPFIVAEGLFDSFEPMGISGILGYPGFDEFTLDIDYPGGVIRLSQRPLLPTDPGVTELQREGEGAISVPVELLDAAEKVAGSSWFKVDTGGEFMLHLPSSMASWVEQDLGKNLRVGTGLSGQTSAHKTAPVAGSIRIGSTIIDRGIAEFETPKRLIGHQLLRQFRVRLDPISGLALFTPPNPHAERIRALQYKGIGVNLSLLNNGELVLLSIRANSPAARAGLLPNDRVMAIDGIRVGEDGFVDRTAWFFDPAEAVTLSIRRNDEHFEVTVPLEDVFPANLDELRDAPADIQPPPIKLIRNPDGSYRIDTSWGADGKEMP